jgi:outer membrane beta-barrel protein
MTKPGTRKGIPARRGLVAAAIAFGMLAAAPTRAQEFALESAEPAVPPAPEIRRAEPAPAPAATARGETIAAPAPAAPASTRRVRLEGASENVVRTGPGEAYAIAGVFKEGESFRVIAKSGDWYNIQLSATETAWVHASLCKEFDDLSDLEFRPNPRLYSRTGSFVVGGYAGAYAFDRKSNSLVVGSRLGYYLFDRVQAEVGFAFTRVNRPAEIVESLFDLSLESEKYDMGFYDLGLSFEVLPGRQMVPYVTGGVGSALMQGRSEASFHYGAGTYLFLGKKTLTRWEVRDYRFSSGPPEARRSNNNIAFTFGTSILF